MVKSGRYAVPACAMVLAAAVACGDPYVHTNPYDPDTPVTFEILGADSLFSAGEYAQYSVQSVPALLDTAFSWIVDPVATLDSGTHATTVDGTAVFLASGGGGYVSAAPPLEPTTVTVSVVVLIGQAWSVWVDGFDALGNQVTARTANPASE